MSVCFGSSSCLLKYQVTNTWTQIPVPKDFAARRAHVAVVMQQEDGSAFLIIIGGRSKEAPLAEIVVYDLSISACTLSLILFRNETMVRNKF